MKSLLSGICVTFSMYSAIPAPQISWDKHTMRYALACLPLIGLLIGGLEYGWFVLSTYFQLSTVLYAVIATVLPILVTGGIHLDGYVDTCDALSSHADREKKLEILKDPHVGAFGPLWLMVLLLLQVGIYAQIFQNGSIPLALLMLTSGTLGRTMGADCVVTLPCAKNSGLAYLFAENAEKKVVSALLWMQTCLILLAIAVFVHPMLVVVTFLLLILSRVLHKQFCLCTFGGVTGDLSGFLNVLTETMVLAVIAIGGLTL